MKASAFMSTLSTAGRLPEDLATIGAAKSRPSRLVVDRWVKGGWVSVELVWDGEKYAEVGHVSA